MATVFLFATLTKIIVRMKNSIALPASRPANAVPSMTAIQKARIIRYAKSINFAFALLILVGTADTASVPFLVFNIVWFAAAAALLAKGGEK